MAALGQILKLQDDRPIGQHPDVSLFMRGVFNVTLQAPKHYKIWDVSVLLGHLRTLKPAHTIPLKDLTLKLVVLILLTTGQRSEIIAKLDLGNLVKYDNHWEFVVTQVKQTRPGYTNPVISLRRYPTEKSLCVLHYLKVYLSRTKTIRDSETRVILTHKKPYHPVAQDTVYRWTKSVLAAAGLDTTSFTGHSIRSAATSTAAQKGLYGK